MLQTATLHDNYKGYQPMNIGLIGIRGHAGMVFPALRDGHKVAAFSVGGVPDDPSGILSKIQRLGSNPSIHDDWREVLDSGIEMLIVAGPFHKHAEIIEAALVREIPVLCEKPAANSPEELNRLEATWRAHSVPFSTMMNLRGEPAFLAAYQAVSSGAIGDVRIVHAQKSYKLGQRPKWFHERSQSTGLLPWVGSHALDLIRWYAGREFVSVSGYHSNMYNREHGELEVSATCHCILEDEITATADCDFLRPDNAPTHGDDRVRIVGTDGVAEVREGTFYLTNAEHDGTVPRKPAEKRDVITSFLEGSPLVPTDEVFSVTRACLSARADADSEVERSTRHGFV